ncbi:NAD(P)H-dependent oxidoreductase [Phytohabitans houttuyneae]|uniref:Putative reductase n=1 Tax=Phytohabitans houttuyneae TaxID=1076126 RepID=A0A6V8KQ58_9ACTN|nr:putative reductase [Phytohabitans houttuyneae]
MEPLRIAVIVGSTREGRVGDRIARWFVSRAAGRDGIELRVLDLLDYELPARYPKTPTPQVTAFAAEVGLAEAFVVVTPEYNRSFPASLKQAIDYAYDEWRAKPVGFVSYGHRSDGLCAVEQLRPVFCELHAVTMRDAVRLDLMHDQLDEDDHAVAAMLDQLAWWGLALREARAARPYVA